MNLQVIVLFSQILLIKIKEVMLKIEEKHEVLGEKMKERVLEIRKQEQYLQDIIYLQKIL